MTVPSTVNRADFVGTGAASVFPYGFRIFVETDLLVTVRNTSTQVETTLILDTDYTVEGEGDLAGGTITLVDVGQPFIDGGNLATGFALTVRRVLPLIQNTDFRNQTSFFPETHEDEFDRSRMIDQQQDDELDRSIRLRETVPPSTVSNLLPIPQSLAFLRWNAAATELENALLALSGTLIIPGGSGMAVFTSPLTFSVRNLIGSPQIAIANADGQLGNPTFTIIPLSITAAELAALAVETAKIAALAVTAAKLGAMSVETSKINSLAVTAAKLAALAVETAKIKNLAVTQAKLALLSVGTPQLIDASVTAAKLAAGAAGGSRIVATAQNFSLGNSIVETDMISHTFAAGALVAGDVIRIRTIGRFRADAAGDTHRNTVYVGGVVARQSVSGSRAASAFATVIVETTIHVRSDTSVNVTMREVTYDNDFAAGDVTILNELEGVNEITIASISGNATIVRQSWFWDNTPGLDPSVEMRNLNIEHINA